MLLPRPTPPDPPAPLDAAGRCPGAVPRDPAIGTEGGFDTDRDGRPDTVLVRCGEDLLVGTDLDGDGFADQILRIGPDGAMAQSPSDPGPAHGPPWQAVVADPAEPLG